MYDFEGRKTWERYERQYARRVLDNVKQLKRERGLTTADLVTRLQAVGWPTTLNSMNGMLARKGRATITLTELIAFAEALGVPPLQLVFGKGDAEEQVWYDFRLDLPRAAARQRFAGSPDMSKALAELQAQLDSARESMGQLHSHLQAQKELLVRSLDLLAEIPADRREAERWTFDDHISAEDVARFDRVMFETA